LFWRWTSKPRGRPPIPVPRQNSVVRENSSQT
jgi:hypothetical protein